MSIHKEERHFSNVSTTTDCYETLLGCVGVHSMLCVIKVRVTEVQKFSVFLRQPVFTNLGNN